MLLLKTSLEILPSQHFRNAFMNNPRVEHITRKSAVLSTSSMNCLSDVSTINLTVGCAHGCLYCYTQGYSSYPGNSVVQVYDSLPQQLENELNKKRRLPRRVYFSPSSDLFQPIDGFADVRGKCSIFSWNAKLRWRFSQKDEFRIPFGLFWKSVLILFLLKSV